MSAYANLIPVNVLTGALGSGKTSVLRAALRAPQLHRTVVLVNELGEVGIDHHLLEHASESTLLLENGCICCAMRDDLKTALKDLHSRRSRGELPHFDRIVLETTGVADPVPIAYTLLAEPVLQHHFRLGNVVTVVDAVNADRQLDAVPAYEKQVALADRVLVSKLDLADSAPWGALQSRLRSLNTTAPLLDVRCDELDMVDVLVSDAYQLQSKNKEVARWLRAVHDTAQTQVAHHGHHHAQAIEAHCLRFDTQLDWTAFGVWMSMLLHRHGDKVLRIKGLLNLAGLPGPVLINGVQHLVHPPSHLAAWPDDDHSSRLVVIVHGLERSAIERSLNTFNAIDNAALLGGTSATNCLATPPQHPVAYAPDASHFEMHESADATNRTQ